MDKKSLNTNLNKANINKNDEFYTQLSDIEKELGNYKNYFKGKIIFCNCDDPEESNFFKYFALNFKFLGLKKLITTHFEKDKPSYKLEIVSDINKDGKIDTKDSIKTPLKQNGDFRSPECIEILKEADIVVTNPPFSLFREYITKLVEHNKKFLVIGNVNALTTKEIFNLVKKDKIWLGINHPKRFRVPNYYENGIRDEQGRNWQILGNTCWYTNLEINKRHEDLLLYKEYDSLEHVEYDNYKAINIDKVKNIPLGYKGLMGVPVSFLDKYNPEQFEIVAIDYEIKEGLFPELIKKDWKGKIDRGYINNKRLYARLFIKNKKV
jgi:hypothetical protein